MQKATNTANRKLSPRQEAFVQAFVAGTSSTKAYMDAYGVSEAQANSNATRTLKRLNVMRRIAELQAQSAKDSGITVQSISIMLRDAYNLSIQTKQASAASQAAMGLAKLHGLITDKSEVNAVVRRPSMSPDSPDNMTEEAWLEEFGGLRLPPPSSETVN